ncbi:hypothetical protein BpHYR1_038284 [Brachionus plicatilis]|uniref:Uncharacterized protein n=1 Tax=Brachionus plicatilis TaxID=10195 RepID=A0A3M7PT26_BRAPC|nr:hypothetical protein BpHYR1_038284 [Brachionus plicatilis]
MKSVSISILKKIVDTDVLHKNNKFKNEVVAATVVFSWTMLIQRLKILAAFGLISNFFFLPFFVLLK